MPRRVYKVCTAADWRAAVELGTYAGSADDLRDGFIHLSTLDQLAGTLAKHFSGQAELVLLAFDANTLGDRLTWEPSRGGQLFPHLYALLAVSLALSIAPLPAGADGTHSLPGDLR